jgi:hypothetical protein
VRAGPVGTFHYVRQQTDLHDQHQLIGNMVLVELM